MDTSKLSIAKRLAIECISLSSARGRLLFWVVVSTVIFLLPISMLTNLSIWKRLDWQAPSVGLSRSYHYLLHGQFNQAWHMNSIIFLVTAIGLPLLLKDVYNVVKEYKRGNNHGSRDSTNQSTS